MEFLLFLVVAGMIAIAGIAIWVGRRGRRSRPGVRSGYSGFVGGSYDGASSGGGWFDGGGGGFGGDGGGGGGGCGGGS